MTIKENDPIVIKAVYMDILKHNGGKVRPSKGLTDTILCEFYPCHVGDYFQVKYSTSIKHKIMNMFIKFYYNQ